MFKVAKSFDTTNELVDIRVVEAKVGYFDSKTNKSVYNKRQELEINISGNIGNDEYCLHFIIEKPIEDYFKIKKYDKIIIKENEIIDNYFCINGLVDLGLIINLEVVRFSKTLIFNLCLNVIEMIFLAVRK